VTPFDDAWDRALELNHYAGRLGGLHWRSSRDPRHHPRTFRLYEAWQAALGRADDAEDALDVLWERYSIALFSLSTPLPPLPPLTRVKQKISVEAFSHTERTAWTLACPPRNPSVNGLPHWPVSTP
jgi:hypothetical protein